MLIPIFCFVPLQLYRMCDEHAAAVSRNLILFKCSGTLQSASLHLAPWLVGVPLNSVRGTTRAENKQLYDIFTVLMSQKATALFRIFVLVCIHPSSHRHHTRGRYHSSAHGCCCISNFSFSGLHNQITPVVVPSARKVSAGVNANV